MSDNEHYIEQARALHSILIDPSKRGLVGTMALSKLKSILKKAGPLPEFVRLTPERLEEFRLSNLIASADIALAKFRDSSRDIKNRFEQLNHLEHYIKKADCGWQAIGLTQRDFIGLKISLHCERIRTVSDCDMTRIQLTEEAGNFMKKLLKQDEITKKDFSFYSAQLAGASEETADNLKKSATDGVFMALENIKIDGMKAADKLEVLQDARKDAIFAGLPYAEAQKLSNLLDNEIKAATIIDFRDQYKEIISSATGFDATEKIDELVHDMEINSLDWSGIGIDEDEVAMHMAKFNAQGVREEFAQAKEYFSNGDVQKAASHSRHVMSVLKYNDLSSTGLDIAEIEGFDKNVLKTQLQAHFDKAASGEVSAKMALWLIESMKDELRFDRKVWSDIDPALNDEIMETRLQPLCVAAANEEVADYMQSREDGCLWNAANLLHRAKSSWDAVSNIADVRIFVENNRHKMPVIGNDLN